MRLPAAALLLLAVAALLPSCSGTEKGAEAEADIEAAMIEGREAARIFVNRPWRDTVELRRRLHEARSRRARYDTLGRRRSAEAYDSAFVKTIRTVSPDVARHIR